MVLLAPVITGIVRYLYFNILLASCLIIFLSAEIATSSFHYHKLWCPVYC